MFKHKRANSDRGSSKAVQEETRELEHLLTMRLTTNVAATEAELESVKRELAGAQAEMEQFEVEHQAQFDELYEMVNILKQKVNMNLGLPSLDQDQPPIQLQVELQGELQGEGQGEGQGQGQGQGACESHGLDLQVENQVQQQHQQYQPSPIQESFSAVAPTPAAPTPVYPLQQPATNDCATFAEDAPVVEQPHALHDAENAADSNAAAVEGPLGAPLGAPLGGRTTAELGPILEHSDSDDFAPELPALPLVPAKPNGTPNGAPIAVPSRAPVKEPGERYRASAPAGPAGPGKLGARLAFLKTLHRPVSAETSETSSVYSGNSITPPQSVSPLRYSLAKRDRFVFSAARKSVAMTQMAGKVSRLNRKSVLLDSDSLFAPSPDGASTPLFAPRASLVADNDQELSIVIDSLKSIKLGDEHFLNGHHLSYFFAKK